MENGRAMDLHIYKVFWKNVSLVIDIKNYHSTFNQKLGKIETINSSDLKVEFVVLLLN